MIQFKLVENVEFLDLINRPKSKKIVRNTVRGEYFCRYR